MLPFVLSLLLLASGNIEMGPGVRPPQEFQKIVIRTVQRLEQVAPRRLFRFKGMNNSLEKTAEAAGLVMRGGEPRRALDLLEGALRDYDGNSFAVLLQGLILEDAGDPDRANEYYESFLVKSAVLTDFEKAFMRWYDFHTLRRYVYDLLKSRGFSFEGREEEIQTRVPFRAFLEYLVNPGKTDQVMNIVFVLVILGGGVLLVFSGLMGAEFFQPVMRSFVGMYVIFWICYGAWIFDLVFGLPFSWSRFYVIPVLLTLSTIYFIVMESLSFWREKYGPVAKGFRRCPHCHYPNPELMMECMECRHPIGK